MNDDRLSATPKLHHIDGRDLIETTRAHLEQIATRMFAPTWAITSPERAERPSWIALVDVAPDVGAFEIAARERGGRPSS